MRGGQGTGVEPRTCGPRASLTSGQGVLEPAARLLLSGSAWGAVRLLDGLGAAEGGALAVHRGAGPDLCVFWQLWPLPANHCAAGPHVEGRGNGLAVHLPAVLWSEHGVQNRKRPVRGKAICGNSGLGKGSAAGCLQLVTQEEHCVEACMQTRAVYWEEEVSRLTAGAQGQRRERGGGGGGRVAKTSRRGGKGKAERGYLHG